MKTEWTFLEAFGQKMSWWQQLLVRISPGRVFYGFDYGKDGDYGVKSKMINGKIYVLEVTKDGKKL